MCPGMPLKTIGWSSILHTDSTHLSTKSLKYAPPETGPQLGYCAEPAAAGHSPFGCGCWKWTHLEMASDPSETMATAIQGGKRELSGSCSRAGRRGSKGRGCCVAISHVAYVGPPVRAKRQKRRQNGQRAQEMGERKPKDATKVHLLLYRYMSTASLSSDRGGPT